MGGTTIATATTPRGTLLLRRRDDGALELRVNGVFVMDSVETSTESALAEHALAALEQPRDATARAADEPNRILVGGLGLGYTLRRLVESRQVQEIVVVEIEGALIDWHRRGDIISTADIIDDPRVCLVEADVRDAVEGLAASSLDALILDVDNGPGFLVYAGNAALYRKGFLESCRRALRGGGALVVWSADEAPTLEGELASVFGVVEHHPIDVVLGTRNETYHVYRAAGDRCGEGPAVDVEPPIGA